MCRRWTILAPCCSGSTGGGAARRTCLPAMCSVPCWNAWQSAAPRGASLAAQFDALGKGVLDALVQLRDFVILLGQLALDCIAVLLAPRKMPWRDFSGSLFRIGAQALPITALVGFLIGVVLAYLMSQVLRQFGAETFIVNLRGLALVRELGPLLGAVLVAGRSGSSSTARRSAR